MGRLQMLIRDPKYALDRALLARRPTQSSSISDNGLFPAFCAYAAQSDRVFRRFRRSPIFEAILEHTSPDLGEQYWNIARANPLIAREAKSLASSDTVGGPRLHDFSAELTASPSLMRYLKVASDLQQLFGDLSGLNIVELGGGYGGQARVLESLFAIESYTIIDLPEVSRLQKRYLSENNLDLNHFAFINGRSPSNVAGDLLISNYAVSELTRNLQDHYSKQLIEFSRGYITFNRMATPGDTGMTATEFVNLLPDYVTQPEYPATGDGNLLITWSTSVG